MSGLDKLEFVKPADIETRSFEIITHELGDKHIDPENVMKTVRELGLEGFPNINYIRAMKQAVGMEA